MSKHILITGITGFVGSYVVDLLLQQRNYTVSGTQLHPRVGIVLPKAVITYTGNLQDQAFCNAVLSQAKPDYIIHLAAQSWVFESWQDPDGTIENNVIAQLRLLEAMRLFCPSAKMLVISSADVYGDVAKNPISELFPLQPNNPYAISKIMQEELATGYCHTYGLQSVRIRPFGHIGPGQPARTAMATFIDKIRKTANGGTILVGDITVKRDYSDVRDIARAYILALERAEINEVYNIGAGKSYVLSDILDTLIALSGKTIKVSVDKSLIRPHDIMETVSDNTKFHKATGWEPHIGLDQTLFDMWERASSR